MNIDQICRIFEDTAYVRMGGSEEELRCAQYLQEKCRQLGAEARIEDFSVPMAYIHNAKLFVDGQEICCKGYFCAGNAELEAPFYYLRSTDTYALSQCRGKIVMIDGYMGYWRYQDIVDNGAVGFITYDGHINYTDWDIDQRELRSHVSKGRIIPGVNINVKDAVKLVEQGAKTARIELQQDQWEGNSRNVVLDLPGEREEYIVLSAHYDSTSLSQGAYDNMTGSVGLLGIAEYFLHHPHSYGLRFVWCGSEERGLLGAKAYVADHAPELDQAVLNVNLDMIGCVMGKFIACCTAEEKLCNYIEYFGNYFGMILIVNHELYYSDSTPFADAGIPAISFARIAPPNTATIHNSYDTSALVGAEQMLADIDFLCAFVDRMANAKNCPVKREIPENMKTRLDEYLCRKRPANA
ncbi:MAG: Zn-dependent exopeptidase M28 [Oscillospiraceae bacterium]|nr:Zn-dependent exopeptidase M28 [Oscillospiraceae bacterium]